MLLFPWQQKNCFSVVRVLQFEQFLVLGISVSSSLAGSFKELQNCHSFILQLALNQARYLENKIELGIFTWSVYTILLPCTSNFTKVPIYTREGKFYTETINICRDSRELWVNDFQDYNYPITWQQFTSYYCDNLCSNEHLEHLEHFC